MPPGAKNKKVDSNTELENLNVDFNTLNCPEKSINSCDTSDESKQESSFSLDIGYYDSSSTDFSP